MIFGIFRVLHVHHVRRVVVFAAVRFERFVNATIMSEPRMGGVRNHGKAGVEGNRAKRVEFILHVAIGLGVLDVGQIHDVHAEGAKAAIADMCRRPRRAWEQ